MSANKLTKDTAMALVHTDFVRLRKFYRNLGKSIHRFSGYYENPMLIPSKVGTNTMLDRQSRFLQLLDEIDKLTLPKILFPKNHK